MKTIHFKNGKTLEVNQEVLDILSKNVKEGTGQFQTFSIGSGPVYLFINLSEINFIN